MERAYKPGSVFVWSSICDARYRAPLAVYREARRAASALPLTLLRVGFAGPVRHRTAGALLPHHFTLTAHVARRYLSVALSVGSPRQAVSLHPALRSPDFPQAACAPCDHPSRSSGYFIRHGRR